MQVTFASRLGLCYTFIFAISNITFVRPLQLFSHVLCQS
jgi:hypothetical protein